MMLPSYISKSFYQAYYKDIFCGMYFWTSNVSTVGMDSETSFGAWRLKPKTVDDVLWENKTSFLDTVL